MDSTIVVRTTAGDVCGLVADGITRFLGIPFAAPPVGDLRFAAPQSPPRWDGVRDATARGPNAPQPSRAVPGIDLTPIVGTGWRPGDDYLTVDVWTPDPGATALPVMVFVHGGAFIAGEPGSPAYDGTALAREGVVLVSVTYRLGVEGFLPLPGGSTNIGLRDQLAALTWVQENVAAFGGDPGAVTAFGESAGAMCLSDLLGSPLAAGLFGRVILQSGGADMVRGVDAAARLVGATATALGVTPDADGFRARSVTDVLAAQDAVSLPPGRPDLREPDGVEPGCGIGTFLPVIGDDVLPHPPLQALRPEVDVLAGTNRDEMHLYYVPTGVVDAITDAQVGAMLAAVHPHPETLPTGDGPGATLVAATNELVFHGPARRLREAHPGTTFGYDFSWPSPACDGRLGACHGLELPFLFGTLDAAPGLVGDAPPAELGAAMRRAWTSFARTGDPGPSGHEALTLRREP